MGIAELRDEIGVQIHGLTYIVDIINACGLSCPTCPQGNVGRRDGKKMSITLWRDILAKAQKSMKIRKVAFCSFSDPLLHPDLPELVRMVSSQGIPCFVSTTLNHVKCSLPDLCRSGVSEIRVGFSGFKKYGFYQTGGHLETVLQNIQNLQSVRGDTKCSLIFHKYKSNAHELPAVRHFAKSLGWGVIEVDAIYLTLEKIIRSDYESRDLRIIDHLPEHPQDKLKRVVGAKSCFYQRKEITLDASGRVYLCDNVYGEEFVIGDFMAESLFSLRKKIREHPFCRRCIDLGGNRYYY